MTNHTAVKYTSLDRERLRAQRRRRPWTLDRRAPGTFTALLETRPWRCVRAVRTLDTELDTVHERSSRCGRR